jgi:surface protein
MKRFIYLTILLTLFGFFYAHCYAQENLDYLKSFPSGSSPEEIGSRIANHFVGTLNAFIGEDQKPNYVHYPVTCTWAGALEFAAKTGDKDLQKQLQDAYLPLDGYREDMIPIPDHVDYAVFGIVPFALYRQTKEKKYLDLAVSFADKQWGEPFGRYVNTDALYYYNKGLSFETRMWIDDMYMITALQTQAYVTTGDMVYLDRAAKEMVYYIDSLEQPNGLFYHAPDAPFYWGRGNGWMAVGMTEVLKLLPLNHPDRPVILAGYLKMMASLLNYQDVNGVWHQLIDDPDAWEETSSTGMFTYAFITGVKERWLDNAIYGPAARKAWLGLISFINSDNNITNVCEGTNKKNDRQYYLDRKRNTGDLHGQAPVLWCANALQMAQVEPSVLTVDASTGNYTVTSQITGWHFSGSVGQPLSNMAITDGSDDAGSYTKTSFSWDGGNKTGSIRCYKNSPVVIFDISLPNGQTGSLGGFPSFTSMPAGMHPFSYHDDQFSWPEFRLNETSSPWLFFDDNKNACVISPASHFMVAKMQGDGAHTITSTINADITSYPAGFTYSTIMVMDNGIRDSWDDWGATLRNLYHRSFADKDQDPLLKYYGYWTDNGADYYYNYDTNLGYEQTLLNLKQYYTDNDIPMGYMQLDSWWYEKSNYSATGVEGPGYKNSNLPRGAWNLYGGLMSYVADPFVFPDGLSGFQGKLGLPLATHNRWIDPRSDYNQQYQVSGIMSADPSFWRDIMGDLKAAKVACYEQDWLDYIYRGSSQMQNTLTVADAFTDEMAGAAAANGINLQYCMAMPRYFLQGLKYNNLTTIRTSDDIFKNNKWFKFLFTSQLAYETGVMPWSDVFKSSQLGNMVLSVLSSGPVGSGDAIGKESKANILLAARSDGEIVRPDVPILPLDQSYLAMAVGAATPVLGYTYTQTAGGNITTDYLYAFCDDSHTVRSFSFKPEELGALGQVAIYNPLAKTIQVQAATTAFQDEVSSADFNYYIIAPVTSSGIAFLGDAGKIAATGAKRILSIQPMGKELQVTVQFAAGESSVVLQGYCPQFVRADKGDVQMDAATHVFSVKLDKPSGSDQATITFTPTEVAAIAANVFATTWKTDNAGGTTTNIQFKATGSNFNIHWEDLFDPSINGDATGVNGDNTVNFPKAGTYIVSIAPGSGTFTSFQLGTSTPKKLLSVEQWGAIGWTSLASAFSGATNLMLNAVDTPHLSLVTSMSGAFKDCSGLTTNPAMTGWHTSHVTDMSNLFNGATSFNQNIEDWDVSHVTNLNSSFKGCKSFNQPLDNWDVSSVTNMSNLFNGATAFNQPLNNWDVSQVDNIGHLLQSAHAFNQDLSHWNVSSVTNMAFMFYDAKSFNSNIGGWNTSKVVNMVSLFNSASAFNQNLGEWDLSSIAKAKNNDGSLVSMLSNSGMDCSNYSQTLKDWSQNSSMPSGLSLGVASLSYDQDYAANSRDILTSNKSWTISGDVLGHCSIVQMPVPVILASFAGYIRNGQATLTWKSGVELRFDHYELEALNDNRQQEVNEIASMDSTIIKGQFALVGTKTAQGTGTSYSITVPQTATTAYYRLKMIDLDGKSSYSQNIVKLHWQPTVTNMQVYPNPANNYINVRVFSVLSQGTLRVFDAAGKQVGIYSVSTGNNKIPIARLNAGIYFAVLEGDVEKIRFIKK